jgi:hypothetical protein
VGQARSCQTAMNHSELVQCIARMISLQIIDKGEKLAGCIKAERGDEPETCELRANRPSVHSLQRLSCR